jgi:diguanylate cyclase (GGDEF)-like protein
MLLYVFTTLAFFDQEKISTIMFGTAGLALIISLLHSSYNMAYRDELTGLLGRRALNDRLKGLGKKYVIAMTDVDHFKKFNDTFGHNIGDDVLKMVGKKIESIQGGGTAYRYGGEEFCIVFPGKSLYECKPFLEVIRESVENYKMAVRNARSRPKTMKTALQWRGRRRRIRNKNVSVTISIGAAESNRKNSSPDSVLKAADAALYEAKKNGRNCLMLS